jgi:RNA polymerase sigma-70 factor (ECF subfamily)
MDEHATSAAVQSYLDELAGIRGDSPSEPVISALLGRSVRRLNLLCGALLHRNYKRLTRPPVNLQTDELLSAVVERLLKALRESRPDNVRGFFALATKHMCWELNDVARRLNERPATDHFAAELLPNPQSSGSAVNPNTRRMLNAIDGLPEEEREVFSLVRIQGMTQAEVASLLDVSTKTVQRRLSRGMILLTQTLSDLRPNV